MFLLTHRRNVIPLFPNEFFMNSHYKDYTPTLFAILIFIGEVGEIHSTELLLHTSLEHTNPQEVHHILNRKMNDIF